MKQILMLIVFLCIWIMPPYLCVGIAWLFSIGAFEYQEVVTSGPFYSGAIIYYMIGWAPASWWYAENE